MKRERDLERASERERELYIYIDINTKYTAKRAHHFKRTTSNVQTFKRASNWDNLLRTCAISMPLCHKHALRITANSSRLTFKPMCHVSAMLVRCECDVIWELWSCLYLHACEKTPVTDVLAIRVSLTFSLLLSY